MRNNFLDSVRYGDKKSSLYSNLGLAALILAAGLAVGGVGYQSRNIEKKVNQAELVPYTLKEKDTISGVCKSKIAEANIPFYQRWFYQRDCVERACNEAKLVCDETLATDSIKASYPKTKTPEDLKEGEVLYFPEFKN